MHSLLFQAATLCLPEEENKSIEIDFHFLAPREMAQMNMQYVGHEGITDVICFNYPEAMAIPGEEETSHIEIFICPEAALKASEKPGRTYESEIVLYVVHGLLHAAGENDLSAGEKKKMRKKEKSVTGKLRRRYNFEDIFKKETRNI